MREKSATKDFYSKLGFQLLSDYEGYLIMQRDSVQIHFFEFKDLNPSDNYGQVYIRTDQVDELYKSMRLPIHANGQLQTKPWGQKEFSMLDPGKVYDQLILFKINIHQLIRVVRLTY